MVRTVKTTGSAKPAARKFGNGMLLQQKGRSQPRTVKPTKEGVIAETVDIFPENNENIAYSSNLESGFIISNSPTGTEMIHEEPHPPTKRKRKNQPFTNEQNRTFDRLYAEGMNSTSCRPGLIKKCMEKTGLTEQQVKVGLHSML